MGESQTTEKKVPKNAKATIDVPAIDVYVRYAFYNDGVGECFSPGGGITGVTFEIDSQAQGKKTAGYGNNGRISTGVPMKIKVASELGGKRASFEVGWMKLPLTGVADGDHTLKVVPPSGKESEKRADPDLKDGAKLKWRPLFVKITLKDGKLTAADAFDPTGAVKKVNHGYVTAFDATSLAIDMKPDWVKPNISVSARPKPTPTLIVVHHTSGRIISGALNEALNAKGPHYEIDLDGHIVKFAEDEKITSHSGTSKWAGVAGVNSYALGIEVVNKDGPFTEPQYESLLWLLEQLVKAHSIPKHRVVGHSDIRTQDKSKTYRNYHKKNDDPTRMEPGDINLLADDRATCPGPDFDWPRLEKAGYSMIPKDGVTIGPNDWGGYFAKYTEALRYNDRDDNQTFGGKKRDDVKDVVRGMQTDLAAIGYSVTVNGVFDRYTEEAADRFKRHFFTGARAGKVRITAASNGDIDKVVADMIKAVLAGLPAAPATAPAVPATAPAAPAPAPAAPASQPAGGGKHAEAEEDPDHGDRYA